nr:protein NRT1/ PTR FAMILY 1.2-like [Coffea arabica]
MKRPLEEKKDMVKETLLSTSSPKGGSGTMPFIIANSVLEKVATYGVSPNMTLYLLKEYHMEMATASNILFYLSAANNFTPVLGAIVADAYVGRFHMIVFGCVISFLGTIVLWLTTMIPQARPPPCNESSNSCTSATSFQLFMLFTSFILLSVGAGGIRSASLAFGADQFEKRDGKKDAVLLQRYFSWYYVSYSLSLVLALTCMVYIQDQMGWQIGFGASVVVMFFAAFLFFLASPIYIKVKAKVTLFTELVQVIVASYKNKSRKLLSSSSTEMLYHHKNGSMLVFPSEKMRFLNKACIIHDPEQDLTPDGRAKNPWNLCTVDQVEDLKALLKVIPIWLSGIVTFININQTSFSVLQASSMDRKIIGNFEIPAGSFGIFNIISMILWVAFYDQVLLPIAARIKGKPVYLTARQRMGIGTFISFLSVVVTATVECIRLSLAFKEGISDDPEAIVHMSALWLLPQYCLIGLTLGLSAIAQNEFFISELPRSMSSMASTLCGVGISLGCLVASFIMSAIDDFTKRGGGESWISTNINKGHYDYYFWVLSGLSLANFFFFLICCWTYGPCRGEEGNVNDEEVSLR